MKGNVGLLTGWSDVRRAQYLDSALDETRACAGREALTPAR
jgi:hypothetical protein